MYCIASYSAAAAIQLGHIIESVYHFDITHILEVSILFLAQCATWNQFVLYQNRFDTKDMIHYVYYAIQALAEFEMILEPGVTSTLAFGNLFVFVRSYYVM